MVKLVINRLVTRQGSLGSRKTILQYNINASVCLSISRNEEKANSDSFHEVFAARLGRAG